MKDLADTAEDGRRQAPAVGGGYALAHLSDPHLSTLEGVHLAELLNKRVLGYLSWWRRRRFEHLPEVLDAVVRDLKSMDPDHVVITGDLTHIGLPGEFAQVRDWLARLGRPQEITVIPGNHEAYVDVSVGQTLAQWRPYLASDGMRAHAPLEDLFPSLRLRGPLALIGLSSAVPTAPFLASGAVGQAQMERLEALLRRSGEQGYIRVVMVHHPPMPGVVGARKHLRDGAALRAVLERAGAELVLHGHAHRRSVQILRTARGDIPVIGAASASELSQRPGHGAEYHLYRFSRAGQGVEMELTFRGYDPATGGLVSTGAQTLALPLGGCRDRRS